MTMLPPRLMRLAFERAIPPTMVINSSKYGRTSWLPPMVLPHRLHRCTVLRDFGLAPPGDYRHRVLGAPIQIGYMDADAEALADFDYQGGGDGSSSAYVEAIYDSAIAYGLWYNLFGIAGDYRRQSHNFDLQIDPALQVGAYTRPGEDEVITIKLGTFLAIEDAAQLIFSDPNAPFSELLEDSPTEVFRMPDHNRFDRERLFDYGPIFGAGPGGGLLAAFKLLSRSFDRQGIADYLSSMAAYWVIAHEDAHAYLGHLNYYGRARGAGPLGVAGYSELAALFVSEEESAIRKAAEFDADLNAATRLVDVFFDRAILTDLPAVFKDRRNVTERLLPRCDDFDRAQTLLLLRLILHAAAIGLLVLHKGCVKGRADLGSYPTLAQRITNVALAIAMRALQVSTTFEGRGLAALTNDDIGKVLILVEIELRQVLDIAYLNTTVFADPDMDGVGADSLAPIARAGGPPFLGRMFLDAITHGQFHEQLIAPDERAPLMQYLELHHRCQSVGLEVFWPIRQPGHPDRDAINAEDRGYCERHLSNIAMWMARARAVG